jgi:hypothetical protein
MMNRILRLSTPALVNKYDFTSSSIALAVKEDEYQPMLCEMLLLAWSRASTLSLECSDGVCIRITCSGEIAGINSRGISKYDISLRSEDLEYASSYLLTWYRDGCAEVQHIDIDLRASDGSECMLIITAEKYANPMSAEEAIKEMRKQD